jgi:hypothetical protein
LEKKKLGTLKIKTKREKIWKAFCDLPISLMGGDISRWD